MLYKELQLKQKLDWSMGFTKKKNNKREYEQRDVLDNYLVWSIVGEVQTEAILVIPFYC
jgi:hypothetical protein